MKGKWRKKEGVRVPGVLCNLEPVFPSPVQRAYRNKVEFAIGRDSATGEPRVGVTVGSIRSIMLDENSKQTGASRSATTGSVVVADPADAVNVPPVALAIAAATTRLIRASNLESKVYDRVQHVGVFRTVMVRTSIATGETLARLSINPDKLSEQVIASIGSEFKAACEQAVVECASANASKPLKLVSTQLLLHQGNSETPREDSKTVALHGPNYIHEIIMGKRFRVSADAFFQVNAAAATQLFGCLREWLGSLASPCEDGPPPAAAAAQGAPAVVKKDTTLLDVCCGTGTIGILLARDATRVIGLELVEDAVRDAKHNAELNDVKNVEYLVGRAEATIKDAIARAPATGNIVAIVDPPRAGLHPVVLRAIRNCSRIKHVLYVSCNAKSMMNNVQRLVSPPTKRMPVPPFEAVRARVFDLFPHTLHFEMLMQLSR